jgi:hypothetical protein
MHHQATYIPDGWTLRGHLKEIPGLHGAISFEYRPVLAAQRARITDAMKASRADVAEQQSAEVIAKQLITWNVKHPKTGDAIPITAGEIERLQPRLLSSLFSVIMSARPTDIDPEWNDTEQAEATGDAFHTALNGSLEETESKN